MSLEVGQQAPDFTLPDTEGEPVTLSSFRGRKNVVLVFFPYAFSRTCTDELDDIQRERAAIEGEDTVVLAVSCDSRFALRAFAQDGKDYDFPLLSDAFPQGEVARKYGVFLEDKGHATRGTFVIDKQGVVCWAIINDPSDPRSTQTYCNAVAGIAPAVPEQGRR
jgi:mycoredoxin-dependent peroxiredoxin